MNDYNNSDTLNMVDYTRDLAKSGEIGGGNNDHNGDDANQSDDLHSSLVPLEPVFHRNLKYKQNNNFTFDLSSNDHLKAKKSKLKSKLGGVNTAVDNHPPGVDNSRDGLLNGVDLSGASLNGIDDLQGNLRGHDKNASVDKSALDDHGSNSNRIAVLPSMSGRPEKNTLGGIAALNDPGVELNRGSFPNSFPHAFSNDGPFTAASDLSKSSNFVSNSGKLNFKAAKVTTYNNNENDDIDVKPNTDFDRFSKVSDLKNSNSATNTFNYKSHPNAKTKQALKRKSTLTEPYHLSNIQETSSGMNDDVNENENHNNFDNSRHDQNSENMLKVNRSSHPDGHSVDISHLTPDWIPSELDVKWNEDNNPDFSSSVKIFRNTSTQQPINFDFPSQSETMIHNKDHVKEIPIWKKLNKVSQPNFNDIFLTDNSNNQHGHTNNNNHSVSSTMSTPINTMKTDLEKMDFIQNIPNNPDSPLKLFADNYNTYTKDKLNDVLKKVNDNRSNQQTPQSIINHELPKPRITQFTKNNNNYTDKEFIQNANQIFNHIQRKGFQKSKPANATSTPKTEKIFYNDDNESTDLTSDDYTSEDEADEKTNLEDTQHQNDYTSFDENSKNQDYTNATHNRNESEYTFDELTSDDQIDTETSLQQQLKKHQRDKSSSRPVLQSKTAVNELQDKIRQLELENDQLRDDHEKFNNNVSIISIDDIHTTYPELEVKLKHASQLRLNEAKVLKTKNVNSEIIKGRVKPDTELPNEYGNMILDEKNQRWILVQDKENTDPGSLDSIEDLDVTEDFIQQKRNRNLEVSFNLKGDEHDITRLSDLNEVTFSQTRKRLVSVITDVLSKYDNLQDSWSHIKEIVLSDYHLDNVHGLHKLLPNLSKINLARNSIRYLDGLPKAILSLNVSDNDIENLTSFKQFHDLNKLNVSSNNLLSLNNISANIHLTELNVANNGISSLLGIEKLVNLTKVNLSQNNLSGKIDFNRFPLSNLEVLNLSENKITGIYGLENLPELRILDLNENQLTTISCNVKHKNLKKLLLKLNSLKKLNLEPFPYLRVLKIDGNLLNTVTDIRKLKHLQELSSKCQSNGKVVDNIIDESKNVLSLDLSGNANLDLSNYALKFDQISSNSFLSLTKLVLTAMNLTTIPKNFSNVFPNVRELNLNFNRIHNIDGLAELGNLRRLYLVSNNLTKTENIIQGLTNGRSSLKVLDLRLNPCNVELYPYVFNPTELDLARRGNSPVQLETLDEIESFAIHYEALNKTIEDWEERDTEFVTKISREKRGLAREQYETLFINFFHNIIQLDGTMIKAHKREAVNDLLNQRFE